MQRLCDTYKASLTPQTYLKSHTARGRLLLMLCNLHGGISLHCREVSVEPDSAFVHVSSPLAELTRLKNKFAFILLSFCLEAHYRVSSPR